MSTAKDQPQDIDEKTSSYEKMTQDLQEASSTDQHPEKNDPAAEESTDQQPSQATQDHWSQKQISDLEARNKTLQKALDEEKVRTFAELENMRKRQTKELANARSYAITPFVESLLSIGDALEMGIASSKDPQQKEGLEMIWNNFCQTLKKHDVEIINEAEVRFDHNLHEAIAMQPSETVEANHIIQVVQSGYRLKDRLIRPARVIVSQKK